MPNEEPEILPIWDRVRGERAFSEEIHAVPFILPQPCVDNLVGVLEGARETCLAAGLIERTSFKEGITALRTWKRHPDAALWFAISFAEGVRERQLDPIHHIGRPAWKVRAAKSSLANRSGVAAAYQIR